MTNLSVIILTGNEELHIKRCLEKLAPLAPRQVFVVESQKGDRTHEIAIETATSLGWSIKDEINSLHDRRFDVVTRLDETGNMDANLSEVTFNATHRQEKKLPRFVPLTEAIQAVVHHQITAGSYPQDKDNIANPPFPRKGDGEEKVVSRQWIVVSNEDGASQELTTNNSQLTTLHLVWHDWPGLQSAQFNWALDFVEGRSKSEKGRSVEDESSSWILRLDADEYLTPQTIDRLRKVIGNREQGIGAEVSGLTLELKRRFCGGEIRHATTGIRQVRMFRRGKGRYAETLMDERIVVDGEVIDFDGAFYDDNLNNMNWWREKHRGYAKREAQQTIESLKTGTWTDPRKASYYRLPPYFRAFAYFCIRYFIKGGVLDGYAGWMWNFWQGLWYRLLVDREIARLRRS